MKKSKFEVGGEAFLLRLRNLETNGEMSKADMRLTEIHVTKVGTKFIEGFFYMRYGYLLESATHLKNCILTKKKGGKEFAKTDFVAVTTKFKEDEVYTMEEAKLKMISYIANDFNDDVCINCTCHEDESY